MKTTTAQWALTASLAGCLLLGLTACGTTRQISEDKQSGFLGDYSMLQKGEKGQANYFYVDRTVNWRKYTKVWIKPLELWKADDPTSPLSKMSDESKQELMNSFYAAFYEALTNSFQVVDQGGPDVLVVHAAITDGCKSKPVSNFVTSVYAPLKVISFGKRMITGTDIGVGKVVIEAEALDGQTNQRVAAAIIARAGTKAVRSKFKGTWGDVKLAFDWWAKNIEKRVTLFKQGDFGTANL